VADNNGDFSGPIALRSTTLNLISAVVDLRSPRDASSAGGFARAVFASQLHFLLSVDRPWTLETVVPSFDWVTDAAVASQAWEGFLTWGRIDPDIASILLPSYESTFAHLAELGTLRERFAEHLSAVASSLNLFRSRSPGCSGS
jgi:hypothetical protein